MATANPAATQVASVPNPLPDHLRRLYRAFVTPHYPKQPERTFYVEAGTHKAAAKKIAGTIAALEYIKLDEAEEGIYNLNSITELMNDGLSEDFEARLFECVHLEPKPLPSTGITRFHQYYGPLRHPTTPGLVPRGRSVDLRSRFHPSR
jgi:hypothetical protein